MRNSAHACWLFCLVAVVCGCVSQDRDDHIVQGAPSDFSMTLRLNAMDAALNPEAPVQAGNIVLFPDRYVHFSRGFESNDRFPERRLRLTHEQMQNVWDAAQAVVNRATVLNTTEEQASGDVVWARLEMVGHGRTWVVYIPADEPEVQALLDELEL